MTKIKLLFATFISITLLFSISLAEKTLIVKIEGIDNKKARENAQNAAEIFALNDKNAPSDLRIQWLYEEGAKEIAQALQPYGYYRADIDGDLLYEKETIAVTYRVKPGPQIPIGSLTLDVTDLENIKNRAVVR